MKTPTICTFKKINNKWQAILNPDFLFYMHSTMGFPVELAIEEVNGFSKETLLVSQIESWQVFSKENDINLKKIKKSNLKNKEGFIKIWEQLFPNNEEEIQRLDGMLVMLDDDREMFGFTEADQKQYEDTIIKLNELKNENKENNRNTGKRKKSNSKYMGQ